MSPPPLSPSISPPPLTLACYRERALSPKNDVVIIIIYQSFYWPYNSYISLYFWDPQYFPIFLQICHISPIIIWGGGWNNSLVYHYISVDDSDIQGYVTKYCLSCHCVSTGDTLGWEGGFLHTPLSPSLSPVTPWGGRGDSFTLPSLPTLLGPFSHHHCSLLLPPNHHNPYFGLGLTQTADLGYMDIIISCDDVQNSRRKGRSGGIYLAKHSSIT